MVKIMGSNVYALEGYKRVWKPGKGYTDVSTAYPGGVPMGEYGWGSGGAVEIARIARGTHHLQEYLTPSEIAYAQELHNPLNTPLGHGVGVSSFTYPQIIPAAFTTGTPATRAAMSSAYEAQVTSSPVYQAQVAGTTASRSASTGVAGGGTALAYGGPAVGAPPGGGLNLTGVGSSITSTGNSVISMVTPYIPLATKVVLAVVALKIVLWLVKGKK